MQVELLTIWDNEFEVHYDLEGKYYPPTPYEPAEYPDIHIYRILPMKTNADYKPEWLDDDEFIQAIHEYLFDIMQMDHYTDYYDYEEDREYFDGEN